MMRGRVPPHRSHTHRGQRVKSSSPTGLSIGLDFKRQAGQATCSGVESLDFEITLRIDIERWRTGCEDQLHFRQARQGDRPASNLVTANFGHLHGRQATGCAN